MSEKVTASILIIGNEILSGRTQDVNISHIAKTLGNWGIVVEHCRVIPDVEQIIIDTVNEVRSEYDYIFTTGESVPRMMTLLLNASRKPFRWDLNKMKR